ISKIVFYLMAPGAKAGQIVPLFGLEAGLHNIFLGIWASVGSIICILMFPRVFTPLYLKFKKLTSPNYKTVYLDKISKALTFRKMFVRGVLTVLLCLGLSATLVEFNLLFNPELFIVPEDLGSYTGIPLYYVVNVFLGINLLICPFALGLWSIGWALEDAALMHYVLPDEQLEEFFEIEPVHYRYNGLLGGYAGLSSFFYLISVASFFVGFAYQTGEFVRLLDAFVISLISLIIPITIIPAYIFYWLLGTDYLRKGLKQGRRITEEEYESTGA
ncbi:MAG: hypothetical protein ACFFBD_01820, partial [Candidatus Hodarchaeota archaeon]